MGSPRTAARAAALALLVLAAAGPRAHATGSIRTVLTGADSADSPPVNSLRQILEDVAQPGDTIVFSQNFSIQLDPRYRLEVPVALTGITIQGPAELRHGTLVVRGDGTTITGMRFTDTRVFAGVGENAADGSHTDHLSIHDNLFVNDSGLQANRTADSEFRDNTFDVRQPKGDNVVGDFFSNRPHWSHNTWTDGSKGGFTEANCTNLLFDGGNVVAGNAIFRPRSGRVADNTFSGHLRAYRSDGPVLGTLTLEHNTCGTLGGLRPDFEVLNNTVSGDPLDRPRSLKVSTVVQDPSAASAVKTLKERLVCPFSVGMAQATGDAGFLTVKDNTVTATGGWISGMIVNATALATDCTVEHNTLEGGATTSLSIYVAKSAVVKNNTVRSGGKKGAVVLAGEGSEGYTIEGNTVDGGAGPGILIGAGEGTATLTGNTVKGCKSMALQVTDRTLVSEDCTYKDCGAGVRVGRNTVAAVHGGSITGNTGAGLYADAASSVEVARVAFGGNGGAGIDLAPANVTLNAKRKSANGNMPYPELLEYDASAGKVKGRAEPLSRVDAYAVEEGPRAGNPKNGEGSSWLGEVVAGADGKFTFPAAGRVTPPPSNRLTFTATRQGASIDPVTSEFSPDVICAGASLAMIDQAPDGTPANARSDTTNATLPARYRTVSEDGRWVVFTSKADNLVAGDTNGVVDVFLRDTALGTTTRVNRAAVGGGEVTYEFTSQSDAGGAPSISADGRWIVYTSHAEASFMDGHWYFNDPGVILYDVQTGTSTVVASPLNLDAPLPSGSWNYGGAYYASVSGDGSAVVFSSWGRDYVSGDVGDDVDIFVWTRATGAYERVSVPTGGGDVTNGWQSSVTSPPMLSHDARFAVFMSTANLSGGTLAFGGRIWLRDRQAGTTDCASIDSTGALRGGYDPWVSDDGRFVIFWSMDSLVPADTNTLADVYLRDRQAGTTTLVSANPDGTVMYGDCFEPCISGDGRWMAFRNFEKIWLLDREENTRTVVSGSATIPQASSYCYRPVLSRTGRFLRFETDATNLTDLGGQTYIPHVYLRDLTVEAE